MTFGVFRRLELFCLPGARFAPGTLPSEAKPTTGKVRSTLTTGQYSNQQGESSAQVASWERKYMGPRVYLTGLILAVFVGMVIIAATLGQSSGPDRGTFVTVATTTVECERLEDVSKGLLSQHFTVNGEEGTVTIRGLVFSACVDPSLNLSTNFLDTAYEIAKEVVYRQNDKTAFKTTLEVKTAAAIAVNSYIDSFPEYKGRISVYVGSNPATNEHLVVAKNPR